MSLVEIKSINMAYKYKLTPSNVQAETFARFAGACRFTYNLALEHRIDNYNRCIPNSVNYYDQANELKNMKKVEGYEWLKESPAQTLQQALGDLDKAFKSFFRSGFGFPQFKKKGEGDSFRLPDPKGFCIESISRKKAFVNLPKIGKVKFRLSRSIEGTIKNATIKRETDGWYISFCVEKEIEIAENKKPSIGIDRGISQTIALSDMTSYEMSELHLPDECKSLRERIKVLQRKLSKKKRFSENWKKLNKRISKLHTRIARIRRDFLHKISTKLAKNHGLITLEDLKIKNMSKSAKGTSEKNGKNVKAKSGLNREILFQGWGLFATMLRYKTEWSGAGFELVNPRRTSQRCSHCLYEDKNNRNGKKFKCLSCGHEADADKNAATNINRAGHAQRACGDADIGPIDETRTSAIA